MIVAIDGPSGCGKSTVAKMLAEQLKMLYLDSGAGYRMLAYELIKNSVDIDKDLNKIVSLAEKVDYFNVDVYENKIRNEKVSSVASKIAVFPEVREILKHKQKLFAGDCCVVEGRDMGTVVFPEAEVKIFLTADLEERAKRRAKDVKEKESLSLHEVLQNNILRDKRDSTRKTAPLYPAEDSILIDSTNKTAEEVANEIFEIVKKNNHSKN